MRRFVEKTYIETIGECVDAEWLNNHLNAGKPFSVWIANQIKLNELIEEVDYIRKRLPTDAGGHKVVWMLTISAASMIALSDRGAVGRKIRRHYSDKIAVTEAIDTDDLEPKSELGDEDGSRKAIMKVAKSNAKPRPDAIYSTKVVALPLPHKTMSIEEFVGTILARGYRNTHNFVFSLFNHGYVDNLGWPKEALDWLFVEDGALYINAALSQQHIKYEIPKNPGLVD